MRMSYFNKLKTIIVEVIAELVAIAGSLLMSSCEKEMPVLYGLVPGLLEDSIQVDSYDNAENNDE